MAVKSGVASVAVKNKPARGKAVEPSGESDADTPMALGDEEDIFPVSRATHVDTRLGFIMHDISRLRRSAFDQIMKKMGVTRAQWWVIVHLSRHDGMMQVQLADMLDIGKASLGNLVERLEAGGWIDRRSDPVDGRVKRVYLKRKARQLIEEIHSLEFTFNEQKLDGVTRGERDELLRVLTNIKANLLNMISNSPTQTNGAAPK